MDRIFRTSAPTAGRRTAATARWRATAPLAGSGTRNAPPATSRIVAHKWARFHLEVLTKSYDVPVRDDAGGEGEEGFVDVVAAFPPDA